MNEPDLNYFLFCINYRLVLLEVYRPSGSNKGTPFRKSDPGPPDFRVIVARQVERNNLFITRAELHASKGLMSNNHGDSFVIFGTINNTVCMSYSNVATNLLMLITLPPLPLLSADQRKHFPVQRGWRHCVAYSPSVHSECVWWTVLAWLTTH